MRGVRTLAGFLWVCSILGLQPGWTVPAPPFYNPKVEVPSLSRAPLYLKVVREQTSRLDGSPDTNRATEEIWLKHPLLRIETRRTGKPSRILLVDRLGKGISFAKNAGKGVRVDPTDVAYIVHQLSDFMPFSWGVRTKIGEEKVNGRLCDVYTIEFKGSTAAPPPKKKKKKIDLLTPPAPDHTVVHKPVKEWVWQEQPTFALKREEERTLGQTMMRKRFEIQEIAVGQPIAPELFEANKLEISDAPPNPLTKIMQGVRDPGQLIGYHVDPTSTKLPKKPK